MKGGLSVKMEGVNSIFYSINVYELQTDWVGNTQKKKFGLGY